MILFKDMIDSIEINVRIKTRPGVDKVKPFGWFIGDHFKSVLLFIFYFCRTSPSCLKVRVVCGGWPTYRIEVSAPALYRL